MFEALIARIGMALEDSHVPYMIIGGQAVLLYGNPRMTKDIDITLGVDVEELERIVRVAGALDLEIIPRDFEPFVEKTSVLPTRDRKSSIRVDFIFSFTPYERQAIGRAKTIILNRVPVMFAEVEDVIIHKLFAGRPRDLEDVRSILLKNPGINDEYVRRWLREFDRSLEKEALLDAFERLIKE